MIKVSMKYIFSLFTLLLFLLVTAPVYSQGDTTVARVKFDPARDAAKDLKTAIKQAKKEKKLILLDIGGEWCIWCHRLDEFIEKDATVKKALTDNFVVVKINYSKENKNEKFLSAFPKVPGYPHYFVLDAKGKLIAPQDTGELEKDKSYDRDKLIAFFSKWKSNR